MNNAISKIDKLISNAKVSIESVKTMIKLKKATGRPIENEEIILMMMQMTLRSLEKARIDAWYGNSKALTEHLEDASRASRLAVVLQANSIEG